MQLSSQAYRPATALLELGPEFWDPVAAADFPETRLRFRNDRAAAQIGLNALTESDWLAHFGRFQPLPGTLPQPLALRYHGHQFRNYNPDIGDGRGFTFAQMHDDADRLMDLGTKGSGRTPHSRFGDGRLTLKGGVREILATEMLEALGVPTSRTLSLIETGEALDRGDEPSPTRSAVLVRLSHSHIRIGTFQRLAYERDEENMRRLTGYVLRNLYGEEGDDPVRLLDLVIGHTATLAARYMAAGFVHGVLNTDNINVTGESFDYGPWRFAPTWDPGFTAAYFDHQGLYAFGRQPEAIGWNVSQLAASLRLLVDSPPLIAVLDTFGPRFQTAMADALLWRLGVSPRDEAGDRDLARATESALRKTGVELDRFFHDVFGGELPAGYGEEWTGLRTALALCAPRKARAHAYWSGEPCSMLIDEVETIWSGIAEHDDWSLLEAKVVAIRMMGEALA
ncbi:MAG: selenoprotein [Sphingomonas bacterium]|uniref:protein adenylyltransferase SelO family protein n=1 Tax=Sphingomonas bacterium TaxID=1895847 RepID=UPI002623447C|nr:YdiU family protein [Sphingomonas bacterium]MDB5696902.1 selenoprotein [Sphingomonas bacterium]